MVESLEDDEIEIAARTSYSYWVKVVILQSDTIDQDLRIRVAMREARRHYVGCNDNYETAFVNFKSTIKWRKVGFLKILLL